MKTILKVVTLSAATLGASGCVLGVAGNVVEGAVNVTGDVLEGAVDQVTTSDEEQMKKDLKKLKKK